MSGKSEVKKHRHISELDKIKGLIYLERNLRLCTVEVGDQDCSDPGVLRLYDPDEEIRPHKGMIVIIPADRQHSVKYNGSKDRP